MKWVPGFLGSCLVGFLDAFTHFSATAHDIAKSVNVLERRYQPALKLRLPYIFGPMNVLAAFDPDAARSVYLLKIFPPKAKRTNLKRDDPARWKLKMMKQFQTSLILINRST